MKDKFSFWASVLGSGLVVGVFCFGIFTHGYFLGIRDACATVHAEWRNGKCVRVIEEEVK